MPAKLSLNPKSELFNTIRVGVFLGGTSSERKISLRSGRAVLCAFRRVGLHPVRIDPAQTDRLHKLIRRIDVAFLSLHGKGGEDGDIQAFLDRQKIPYIGSDAKGSRFAYDKCTAKRIFIKSGIPTPDYCVVNRRNWKQKLEKFPVPFVAKPVCDGSSVGIIMVEDFRLSAEKLRNAVVKYGTLLVEKRIEGREFTVGILGQQALPVIELVPKRSFYDYKAKYTKGMTEYRVPAPIDQKLSRRLQKIAFLVHKSLGLRDLSRVDIMLDQRGEPYVLEANSIPGFTELSLLPKAAKAAGLSFEQVCCLLVQWAYERKAKSNGRTKGYSK